MTEREYLMAQALTATSAFDNRKALRILEQIKILDEKQLIETLRALALCYKLDARMPEAELLERRASLMEQTHQ